MSAAVDQVPISVITPWLDHPELIADYEAAVRGAQVIVVDNGSEPAAARLLREMVERLGGVCVRNETNVGFAAANNQGLPHVERDLVLFLNDDVRGEPGFLQAVARDTSEGVLAGPSLQRQLVYGMVLPYLEGWCLAARRATWARIDRWDAETYVGPYWEDNDVCLRALCTGLGGWKDMSLSHPIRILRSDLGQMRPRRGFPTPFISALRPRCCDSCKCRYRR